MLAVKKDDAGEMKRALLTFAALWLLVSSPRAEFDSIPDYTIMRSSIDAVTIVDSFALAVSNEGVTLFKFSDTSAQFSFVDQLYLDIDGGRMKRFGDRLVLKSADNRLSFFDISNLPELTYLGATEFDRMFADFVIDGSQVYLAAWFDGVRLYDMPTIGQAQFVDSSLKGILVTQIDIDGGVLCALDEYNGIVRYNLQSDAIGPARDIMYVPKRGTSFIHYDSLFAIVTYDGVLFGDFGGATPQIVDSVTGIAAPRKIFLTDRKLVLLSDRTMWLLDRDELQVSDSLILEDNLADGDLFVINDQDHLILPSSIGGMTVFNLDDASVPYQGVYRAGHVSDLLIYNQKLFTGGVSNPVDVYAIGDSAHVLHEYSIFPELDSVTAMAHWQDTLMILYPGFNKIAEVLRSTEADEYHLERSMTVPADGVREMKFVEQKFGENRLLTIRRQDVIDVYGFSDLGYIDMLNQWTFFGSVQTLATRGSYVYVATSTRQVIECEISEEIDLMYRSTIGLSGLANDVVVVGDQLIVFQWDLMYQIDISVPGAMELVDEVVSLPYPVVDAGLDGDRLYTVGPEGLMVFDVTLNQPILIDQGGLGGEMMAVGDNVIAVSSGSGIHLYYLGGTSTGIPNGSGLVPVDYSLLQNYPNPFNLETSIPYALPQKAQVKLTIYNLLGQRVKVLVDGEQSAGEYIEYWNGTTESGKEVATGLYFYRLEAGDYVKSHKMLLLK